MPQSDNFLLNLTQASGRSLQLWSHATQDLGVSGLQALLIHTLLLQNNISLNDLAHSLGLETGMIRQLLQELERKHWIDRNPGIAGLPSYRLSDHGLQLARAIHARIQSANDELLTRLSDDEANILKALLKKL